MSCEGAKLLRTIAEKHTGRERLANQPNQFTNPEWNVLIGNLSESKAINENDIPTKIIKLAKFVLAPILTHIFNKCINEGFYPDCLKVAEVIPICKSGEQNICSNYRSISILLQFNKIFEWILYDRVFFYLQEYKLLSKYQFGFRPRSSTSYAVESIYSNLLSNADNGLYSCSIFLDLSEAFDTVNRNILFDKFCHNFGIKGIPLQLFCSQAICPIASYL